MNPVYLIRHGATAGNLEHRYIGRTDEPLCPEGRAQLEELRSWKFQPNRLFVSPMLRTRQTAEILFPSQEYTVTEGLMETDFGIFEGKTGTELWENPAYRDWVHGNCQGEIPDGEPPVQFKRRCLDAFQEAVGELAEGESAAFVIHGGAIMAILEALAEPKGSFYEYHIQNGECVVCQYERGQREYVRIHQFAGRRGSS